MLIVDKSSIKLNRIHEETAILDISKSKFIPIYC